jgi:hypothetical protein
MRRSPTISKQDNAWPIPGHGLRGILNLLESDAGTALVETAVPALITHWLSGSPSPVGTDAGPITLALQDLHGTKPGQLRAILDGDVDDLSDLPDETLLGPLIVPDDRQAACRSGVAITNVITPELAQHLGFIPEQLTYDLRRLEATTRKRGRSLPPAMLVQRLG